MSQMRWCEHCIKSPISGDREEYHLKGFAIYCDSFNYCPICATPRPKEKSLAEKFADWGEYQSAMSYEEMFKELAKIAEEHFNQSKP